MIKQNIFISFVMFESIFVALYSVFIYYLFIYFKLLTHNINNNKNIVYILFIVGFFKHFIGFYSGLHTYYCNNGYACLSVNKNINNDNIYISKYTNLFMLILESITEGYLFCLFGFFLLFIIETIFIIFHKKKRFSINIMYFIIFLIGLLLYLIFEISGLHHLFCIKKCIKKV
jgi:hypothetical protein